jgi:uncharacterized protein YutD
MRWLCVNILLWFTQPALVAKFVWQCRRLPSLALPKTIDEKYLWRKAFDRNPDFVVFSDKLATKRFLSERFPAVSMAEVFWDGDDLLKAPEHLLHSPGYLKANHGSGFNIRLGNKAPSKEALVRLSEKWLRVRYHSKHGEWGYEQVKPKLFIEEDLDIYKKSPITDITVYVFGCKISHFAVMHGLKTNDIKVARYGADSKRLVRPKQGASAVLGRDERGNEIICTVLPRTYSLPPRIESLLEISRAICKESDHLRVDFLWNGNDYYLTEVTIYSMAGYIAYDDKELMERMADAWDLRKSWFLKSSQTGWRRWYADRLTAELDRQAGGNATGCVPRI